MHESWVFRVLEARRRGDAFISDEGEEEDEEVYGDEEKEDCDSPGLGRHPAARPYFDRIKAGENSTYN